MLSVYYFSNFLLIKNSYLTLQTLFKSFKLNNTFTLLSILYFLGTNMQKQKKDLPKQQRRKRKDPQSRDFKCKCGKSYLSYAAVYTHVKNKHDGDKQFQDGIIKPQKQKLKRGRPKDKKQIVISSQTQTLSICQQTTLLIYEKLKQNKQAFPHNIILQGNQQMNKQAFKKQYDIEMKKKKISTNLLSRNKQQNSDDEDDSQIFEKFNEGVIKHFCAQVAAKVSYVINYYAELYAQLNFQDQNEMDAHIKTLDSLDIWQGQNQINVIIYKSMVKWVNILRKDDVDQ